MKAIITGTNGTVAPVVANYFEANNIEFNNKKTLSDLYII